MRQGDEAAALVLGRTLVLPMLPPVPLVTIVIPCLDEEDYIDNVVQAATAQQWPLDKMEILVVDGGSRDRTRVMVEELGRRDERIRLLENPGRFQSAGLNVAIRAARGAVICRMDAHAEYAPNYVAASVEALRATGAMNVGGAARPLARSPYQQAVAAMLRSRLGFGGSAYRDASREGWVESVFNGCFRREVFDIVGMYDPLARTNEDAELNQRILEAGGGVYLARSIIAHYYPRDTLRGLARQYFAYGQGRARTLLKRRRLLSLRPIVPFLALATVALLAAASPYWLGARTLLAFLAIFYAIAVAFETVRVTPGLGGVRGRALTVLPTMHVAHATGFFLGLLRFGPLAGALRGASRGR